LVYLYLVAALVVILLGARFFTNGVEWLGLKLGLARGAVGSVLAAIGTALPETMIPVVAILMGHSQAADEVGIGAILGAPFMLATAGFCLAGTSAVVLRRRRGSARVRPHPDLLRRDLGFFLAAYALAITAAFLPPAVRPVVVVILILTYVVFLVRAVTQGERCGTGDDTGPLLVAPRAADPHLVLILGQVCFAFLLILGGAKVFVQGIGFLAHHFGMAPLLFALLVAPIATEMPELFNSLIWMKEKKDTLAMGNITGAMVFQSTLVPAIGIYFTDWRLTTAALTSAVLALTASWLVFLYARRAGHLDGWFLAALGGSLYLFFVVMVVRGGF
jgi:cation:H+ antiporter